MASTSVDWKPVGNLREGSALPLLLVNAAPSKAVPGRKTEGHDGAWIADLLRHGLLSGSCVPARPPRERRELTR
jgi:transposase